MICSKKVIKRIAFIFHGACLQKNHSKIVLSDKFGLEKLFQKSKNMIMVDSVFLYFILKRK